MRRGRIVKRRRGGEMGEREGEGEAGREGKIESKATKRSDSLLVNSARKQRSSIASRAKGTRRGRGRMEVVSRKETYRF